MEGKERNESIMKDGKKETTPFGHLISSKRDYTLKLQRNEHFPVVQILFALFVRSLALLDSSSDPIGCASD